MSADRFRERARELWFRCVGLVRRGSRDRDLATEMAFHQELLARDLGEPGGPTVASAGAARRQFGNPLALRERAADAWGFPRLEDLAQDIRFGARILRRSPMFAIVAISAIAIAIGINAGFFTLIDALMLQPIPVVNPARMVRLSVIDARGWENIRFSYTDLSTIVKQSKTIEDPVAFDAELVALRTGPTAASAAQASVGCVSGKYFGALGARVAAGRLLGVDDDRAGAIPVAVLSDALWQRAFGRDPGVVGRTLVVDGTFVTIVGVARSDFVGINPLVPDLWMTLNAAAGVGAISGQLTDPHNRFFTIHGRLRPGSTLSQAGAELSSLIAEPKAVPGTQDELTRIVRVRARQSSSAVPLEGTTLLAALPGMALVALVLVIACANLANLLLSRALVRQREIAVRLALGASRRRLLRQLLTECTLIAVIGGALGIVLANWTVVGVSRSLFHTISPALGHIALTLRPTWRVVVYVAGLVMLSVVTFGLTPALYATSGDLVSSLKGGDAMFGTKISRSRFRNSLVAVQVAASLVLLSAAGTLVVTMRSLATSQTGLSVRAVSAVHLGLAASQHVPPALATARTAYASRVATLPGVRRTARAAQPPFTSWPLLHVAPYGSQVPLRSLPSNIVSPGYFDVVGSRIVAGRGFITADSASNAPVAVVTALAARALWPGQVATGQTLRISTDSASRLVRVVGVIADTHSGMAWDWDGDGYVFLLATADDFRTSEMPLLIRAESPPADLERSLGDIARQIDPNAPLRIEALPDLFDFELTPFRYAAAIAAGIGALGLGLAVIGLYGVVAFSVRQRRRDVAVHMAMGAAPRDVISLLLRHELKLIGAGLGIGLVCSIAVSRVLGTLLVALQPLGPPGLIAIAGALTLVAVAASIVPAMTALAIAPMQVLRQE
jgi:predicted permease